MESHINRDHPPLNELSEIYEALKLGLHDYVKKTGFKKSSHRSKWRDRFSSCTRVAVDALGADRVVSVTMPSRYSSSSTLRDAIDMADRLHIPLHQIPIEPLHHQFQNQLASIWENQTAAG